MKKRIAGIILLILGAVPFLLPLVLGLYRMQIERWTMWDWLVLYSFIYWPSYLLGLLLLAAGIFLLCRRKK
ncbi:MAG: LPXTG cell wall anchor domain-containing protein [Ruminococcaceae bacterium]|nr:LPXTG cell wall anchor domain-containing protein [Oscillospiraceae bacterium]